MVEERERGEGDEGRGEMRAEGAAEGAWGKRAGWRGVERREIGAAVRGQAVGA